MFKHLKDNNTTYIKHWWRAVSCGVSLIIHAFYPDVLQDYASKKLQKK